MVVIITAQEHNREDTLIKDAVKSVMHLQQHDSSNVLVKCIEPVLQDNTFQLRVGHSFPPLEDSFIHLVRRIHSCFLVAFTVQ